MGYCKTFKYENKNHRKMELVHVTAIEAE